jgi:Na+-driven multidrug efflux pump
MNCIFFQAAGRPVRAIIVSLARDVACFTPLILILPIFFPNVETILFVAPISDLLAMLVTAFLSISFIKSLRD